MSEEGVDEEPNGLHRQLRFALQNLRLAMRSKGIELGSISAARVLLMAEQGELAQTSAVVDAVRAALNGRNALVVYAREPK